MSKSVKALMMKELGQKLSLISEVIFVDVSKLDGVSNNRMRVASGKQSIKLLGAPFKLAKRVLTDNGWNLDKQIGGPTTIVWGPDVVGLAKQVIKWEKEYPGSVVKGGYVGGQVVTPEEVKLLSECPSKEELIAKVVGGLLSVSTAALSAIISQGVSIASQIKQISEKENQDVVA